MHVLEDTKDATVLRPKDWLVLLLIWAAATACNLFKPFHIDDTVHLDIAEWIIKHPLHPMSGLLNWSGTLEPIYKTNQPHLFFYILALWIRFFGASELSTHLLESLATLACVFLFFRIARYFVPSLALWATALVILGPAFVVEQNVMVDDPLLATWLAFFYFLVCKVGDPRQTRRFVLAALFCSAALLIKYSGLVLVLMLCFALLVERRKTQAWTALIPVAALALWSGFNYLDYGGIHIAARQGSSHRPISWIGHFAAQWVIAVGGLTPLGLLAAVKYRPKRMSENTALAILAFAFAALVLAVEFRVISTSRSVAVTSVCFGLTGALIFYLLLAFAKQQSKGFGWNRERWMELAPIGYLLIWVFLTMVFYVVLSPFIASRHVLLILPAVTVLLLLSLQANLSVPAQRFGLVLTLLVSLGLVVSDWRFATFLRDETVSLSASLPARPTLWTNSHWGWQWYAAQTRIKQFDDATSVLHPGDMILTLPEAYPSPMPATFSYTLTKTDTEAKERIDPFCIGEHVDFYAASHLHGPWQINRDCVFHVDTFVVMAPTSE